MIGSRRLLEALTARDYAVATGVPCSYFAGPLALMAAGAKPRYLPAVNEGSAIAIAVGSQLSGRRSVVLAQNSGFGNMINPLTSLVLPCRIPITVFLSMRGWPTADAGEPQHRWMGQVVPDWLDSLGIAHWMLTPSGPPVEDVLDEAQGSLAFVLVARKAIADDVDTETAGETATGPLRDEVVQIVADVAADGDAHVLSTTGYLSRSLYNLADSDRNFYMQGSMGHVSGIALGAALGRPDRRFVILDGDGAALMHLGALATIGDSAPANLTHVVFDNGVYDSTGAQPTGCRPCDLAAVALACGYRHAVGVDHGSALRAALASALASAGPSLIVVRGAPGGPPGDRASNAITVEQIGDRFRDTLARTAPADPAGGRG